LASAARILLKNPEFTIDAVNIFFYRLVPRIAGV
jgi:hypothetical protein